MLRIPALLTLTTSLIACGHLLANGSPTFPHNNEHSMASPSILIKSVRLIAREEPRPPLGKPQDPDRPIGFASVFLNLENPKQQDTSLTIQKIEIRDAVTGQVQLVAQTPQDIHLKPLENSTNDIHLTNKTGFAKQQREPAQTRLKAVVTYQIGDQVQTIESDPVTIE